MAIDWRTPLAALQAALKLPGVTAELLTIGNGYVTALQVAGQNSDVFFPPTSAAELARAARDAATAAAAIAAYKLEEPTLIAAADKAVREAAADLGWATFTIPDTDPAPQIGPPAKLDMTSVATDFGLIGARYDELRFTSGALTPGSFYLTVATPAYLRLKTHMTQPPPMATPAQDPSPTGTPAQQAAATNALNTALTNATAFTTFLTSP